MKREIARKSLHLAMVGIPVAVWFFPRPATVALLLGAVLLALGVEVARRRNRFVRYHFLRRTRTLLRPHERHGGTGATYMAIAYAAAGLLLPRPLAVTAMLYNGLGDAAAALVGKRWGRHRTRWNKSWEGFAAALVVNLAVGCAVPGVSVAGAVLGALAAAGLEFAPLPLDDNLRVVLGGGLAAWAGTLLVG